MKYLPRDSRELVPLAQMMIHICDKCEGKKCRCSLDIQKGGLLVKPTKRESNEKEKKKGMKEIFHVKKKKSNTK